MSEGQIPEGNKLVVQRFWNEVVNGGNLEVVQQLVASNFILHAPTLLEGEVSGPEGVRSMVEQLRATVLDLHFTIRDQEAIGPNEVVTYLSATGTATGYVADEPDVEPTGATLRWFGVSGSRFSQEEPAKIEGTWLGMVVRGSDDTTGQDGTNGGPWSAGELATFTERVVPGEEQLDAGEEVFRLQAGKTLRCRLCFCMCCT
jgi:hypothetical protein